MSFDEVENIITSHASPGIRPGLERVSRLLALLGNPQGKYPAVHVVGTNGKGSTCAFLDSVFRAAGYKTALYTSPHLESPGERLLVNGRPLPPERWLTSAEKAARVVSEDSVLRDDPPSYFELVTASAFLLAEEERVEAAVVEAGLGGRLDATNLLTDVACTAVASISMDHTEYLGNSLEAIAGEKFAVVRPGTPACYLGDTESLIPLFKRFCADAGALPFVVSRDARVSAVVVTESGCSFDFSGPGLNLKEVKTDLIGRYQVSNATLALSVLAHLRGRFGRLTDETVRAGIGNAHWPGRLEIVSRDPLVVLDGGHNPDGVKKLAESAAELWNGKKIGVVCGMMKDKEYSLCLEILSGVSETPRPALYSTGVPGMERSLSARDVAAAAKGLPWRAVAAFENPLDAVAAASGENEVVLVCGSLYLIGWLKSQKSDVKDSV
ncbi:MAG: bifunctional folylpolyglutamate synthase/dihydrofolate synthase [Synergistaceae bacterium]|nr:bifunctional folylpolyglutamate synthase/dihydrofolate synthase [Synergistaceae bacterium]